MLPTHWKEKYQSARRFREVQVHWRVQCGGACRPCPPVSTSLDHVHDVPDGKAFSCTRYMDATDFSTLKMIAMCTVFANSSP